MRTPNASIKSELGDPWKAKFKIDAGMVKKKKQLPRKECQYIYIISK